MKIDPDDVIAGLRVQLEYHQAVEKRLREERDELIIASSDRDHLRREVERLREELQGTKNTNARMNVENERLRAAYESDEEALRQAKDYARLRRIEAAMKRVLNDTTRLVDAHDIARVALADQPTGEKA